MASSSFKRVSYTEAIEILEGVVKSGKKKFEFPVSWGIDLQVGGWQGHRGGGKLRPGARAGADSSGGSGPEQAGRARGHWQGGTRRGSLLGQELGARQGLQPSLNLPVRWAGMRPVMCGCGQPPGRHTPPPLPPQSEHERYLTEEVFQQPIIVYNYPKEIKVRPGGQLLRTGRRVPGLAGRGQWARAGAGKLWPGGGCRGWRAVASGRVPGLAISGQGWLHQSAQRAPRCTRNPPA